MKYLFSTLLLLCSCLVGLAETVIINGLTISTRGDKTAKISKYSGNEESLTIPSTITVNGEEYTITEVESFLANQEHINTKEVFFPKSIKKIATSNTLFKFPRNSGIRTVVFESGTFEINSAHKPFDFLDGYRSFEFIDNIIFLSSCNFTINNLTSTNFNSILGLKAGEIYVSYNDETPKLNVQMYLFRPSDSNPWAFNQARLDDLLSALRKAGKLGENAEIDLSGLSTSANEIELDNVPQSFVYISDDCDYVNKLNSSFSSIRYYRTNTHDWNSVCLPFDIKESDFPENTKIYQMTGGTDSKILLTRIAEGGTIVAGTPCFIHSEVDEWDLSLKGSLSGEAKSVTQEANAWELCGSFTTQTLGTGKYKLNGDGTAFVQTTESSHVYPFRCYLAPKDNGSGAPARLSVDVDEEASITLVPNDAEPATVRLIDLMGRPRQGNAPGLYIRAKH